MTCWHKEPGRSFSWITWLWGSLILYRRQQLCAVLPRLARRWVAHCWEAKQPRCPMSIYRKHSILRERLSASSSGTRSLMEQLLFLVMCCWACLRVVCIRMDIRWQDASSLHFHSGLFFQNWLSHWLMSCCVPIAATCAKYRL